MVDSPQGGVLLQVPNMKIFDWDKTTGTTKNAETGAYGLAWTAYTDATFEGCKRAAPPGRCTRAHGWRAHAPTRATRW